LFDRRVFDEGLGAHRRVVEDAGRRFVSTGTAARTANMAARSMRT
jgi:hypothetical protein